MKINIYYGGRGIVDDPALAAIKKMTTVFDDLNVRVSEYRLYDMKSKVSSLVSSLKDADGIVLAFTVEWWGFGSFLPQFLDAVWLYGNKDIISRIYMCPVVMSTTYGERKAASELREAWEMLGGRTCEGLCGYVADTAEIDRNADYTKAIEKCAEEMYRAIGHRTPALPSSGLEVSKKVQVANSVNITPKESEILLQFAGDEKYRETKKMDLEKLAVQFKDKMQKDESGSDTKYLEDLRQHFRPQPSMKASYTIDVGRSEPLFIKINGRDLECGYGAIQKPDVEVTMGPGIMDSIVSGVMTFQGAFMGGHIKTRGDFKLMRSLDAVFLFGE
ncbi:MAG: SCP2 sterol-binding domain-containing protein [Lachnospiraceae bacterium]|nr:SCP2 sterol-binding domain-containing protein [Lachnospiraceae bacterium]